MSDIEFGWVNLMVFFGFLLVMVVFGFLYNKLGLCLIMIFVFVGYLFGLVLMIFVGGFLGLFIFIFFIGFVNGLVEVVCNLLVVDFYKDDKIKWFNWFYVWFLGGIVIGVVVFYFMINVGIGW